MNTKNYQCPVIYVTALGLLGMATGAHLLGGKIKEAREATKLAGAISIVDSTTGTVTASSSFVGSSSDYLLAVRDSWAPTARYWNVDAEQASLCDLVEFSILERTSET